MPVTMILQFSFFLDANSIKHIAINVCTGQDEEKNLKNYFQTNISH